MSALISLPTISLILRGTCILHASELAKRNVSKGGNTATQWRTLRKLKPTSGFLSPISSADIVGRQKSLVCIHRSADFSRTIIIMSTNKNFSNVIKNIFRRTTESCVLIG